MPDFKHTHLLGADGFANLGGPGIKAANTRSLLPFVEALAIEFLDDGTLYHKPIRKLFASANQIVGTMYNAGMFLTSVEQRRLSQHVLRFGRHMQFCQSTAARDQEPLWHLTPKVHGLQHLPQQSKLINPRMLQNYIDEGFIGRVTKMWAASANGQYLSTIQNAVLMKLMIGLQLQYHIPVSETLPL